MSWNVQITKNAKKQLKKFRGPEYKTISSAIDKLKVNPFVLDLRKLSGQGDIRRLRAGNYRIFCKLFQKEKAVFIFDIKRRTSTTY